MAHTTIDDLETVVATQSGAVLSKVIHRDDGLDVTVFAFDSSEGLAEHTAARPAILQLLKGRIRLTVDGDEVDMVPGTWVHMSQGAPHALAALEPALLLLTLLPPTA
jgi:quercetin dioxygenase-like cupin family protein